MVRLFASNETNFNHNKWVLSECISCYVTETTDGIFDLDLVYPLHDMKGFSKYIVRKNIIKCPISQTDPRGEQLFVIRKAKPNTKDKTITVYAQAIARYDLMTNFVLGIRVPAGKTRKEAGQILLSACVENRGEYIGTLDTNTNTSINLGINEDTGAVINYLDIDYISPLEGFLGDERSIQNAYGGEIVFNNKEVNMVDSRGADYNILIKSGKNLEELEQEIDDTDSENFATALIMCSSDGVYLPNNEIIYSSNASVLGKYYKKVVCEDVSLVNDSSEALNVVYAQLRERATKLFNEGIDKIKINTRISYVQLMNTEEYKPYKSLFTEKCEIGNNVTARYYKKDDSNVFIEGVGRVSKIKFDVLKNRIEEIEIGERKKSIVNTITDISNDTKTINDKTNKNSKKVKNLKVTMEENNNSIILSITNLKNDTTTKFTILDGQIASKVSEEDFGTLIEQNSQSVVTTIHGESDNQVTINSNGLTVTGGGFLFENIDGEDILKCHTNGAVRVGNVDWDFDKSIDYVLLGGYPLRVYLQAEYIWGLEDKIEAVLQDYDLI